MVILTYIQLVRTFSFLYFADNYNERIHLLFYDAMYSSIVLPHRVKSMIVPGTMKNCKTFNLIQLCKKKSYNNSIILLYNLLYILYLYYLYYIYYIIIIQIIYIIIIICTICIIYIILYYYIYYYYILGLYYCNSILKSEKKLLF